MGLASWITALAGAALVGLGAPQSAPGEDEVGLPVGHKAPDFALEDQHGERRALGELLRTGPLAVVFYRSADW